MADYKDQNLFQLETQCLLYALLVKQLPLQEVLSTYGQAVRMAQSLRKDEITPAIPALWNLAGELAHGNCLTDGCGLTIHNQEVPLHEYK